MTTAYGSGVPAPDGLPLDQIRISGVTARGYHGVLSTERATGQDFSADVVLHVDTRAAAEGDRLADTVSYAEVAQDVYDVLAGEPADLVETVAERIAAVVLARPQVITVDVSVHKPHAPIPVPFADVEVAIRRDRVRTPSVAAPAAPAAEAAAQPGAFAAEEPEPQQPAPHEPYAEQSAAQQFAEQGFGERADPAYPEQQYAERAPAGQYGGEKYGEEQFAAEQYAAAAAVPPAFAPTVPVFEPATPEPAYETPSFDPPSYESPSYDAPAAFEPAPAFETTRPVFEPAPAAFEAAPATFEPAAAFEAPQVSESTAPWAPEPVAPAEPAWFEQAQQEPVQHEPARQVPQQQVPEPQQPSWDDTPAPSWNEAPTQGAGAPESAAGVGHEAPHGERSHDRMDEVPAGWVDVVLALGANLGDPQATLRSAVTSLDRVSGLQITDVSPLARTAAVGGPDQPDYLNAVLLARTTLSARDLLHAVQGIEGAHGRVRDERWGPRTLDIDIIVYGTLTAVADDLELPHPRAHERAFVLEPWSQVAPDAVLPGLGGGPVAALAATAPDRAGIRWLALDWLSDADQTQGGATDVGRAPSMAEAPRPPSQPHAVAMPPSVAPAAGQPAPVEGALPQAFGGGPVPPAVPGSVPVSPQVLQADPHPQAMGSGSLGHPQLHTSGPAVPAPQEAFLMAPPAPTVAPAPPAPPVPLAVRETARQETTHEPLVPPSAPVSAPSFAPVGDGRQAPPAMPVGNVHAGGDEPARPVFAPIGQAPVVPSVAIPLPGGPMPGASMSGGPVPGGSMTGAPAAGGLVTGVPGGPHAAQAAQESSDLVDSVPSWAPVRDDGRGRDT
ncbi:2-amino-4-hydroxy-6-hydroxymethyldihydropteridine diphosphokinase [Antribacter sp. KLBMP9083]|uniref:Bifunctional folate synthesis protein n=1 Tax=Antribacter soli TaxID=2910976 RepID=A0AA41QHE6_9MICO|nr:2-amino-4-hydroxy-6-hydroxymethyldihydropteridine diphosphokinase [Antribacter soli]MCF4122139.1 2-amino-4-hydroxy-6-hydroxymethyldihydropteridine diphosphokinase [Antribacter soli]